jgi:hypothetical protein
MELPCTSFAVSEAEDPPAGAPILRTSDGVRTFLQTSDVCRYSFADRWSLAGASRPRSAIGGRPPTRRFADGQNRHIRQSRGRAGAPLVRAVRMPRDAARQKKTGTRGWTADPVS